jgi:hypothetical protein
MKKPAAKTVPVSTQRPPEFSMALWESLWRVVDASRLAICPLGEMTKEEALEFLADQEKMLRRCLGGDEGEDEMRAGVTPHPFVIKAHEQERDRLRAKRRAMEEQNEEEPT